MRFLQKIVPFVLFSHHGLPSFSVFVSCFGFLGWNCRFPKSVPFASLNFSGAFGKSFMDGFFFFFEFPEMKTFLFARYFTTMHRFFFLRISGIAFCIGFFLVTICYHKLFAVSSRNIVYIILHYYMLDVKKNSLYFYIGIILSRKR